MASLRATITPSLATEDFISFYSIWLIDQRRFLDQLILLSNQNDDALKQEGADRYIGSLIEEVLFHYKRYYEEKEKAMAQEDELGCSLFFFFPPWLTPLEKAFQWMGGFKPSFALSLLEASVNDMTSEQKGRIAMVKEEVNVEEKAMDDAKERVNQRIVVWALVESGEEDVSMEKEVKEEMREVMRRADRLRRETVMKAVESLRGRQTVKFLVAVGSYWLGMRSLGIIYPF